MSSNVNSVIHNMQGLSAQRYLGITNNSRAKTTEKLASGFRINRAADDAAGLAISEKMRRIIRGLTRGTENAQDGVSLCQIADGALVEVSDMLHRITELSIQSANDTNNKEDREAIQSEIQNLLTEIDRVSTTTTFNEQLIFAEKLDESIPELTANEKKKLIQSSISVSIGDSPSVYGNFQVSADKNTEITFGTSSISWDNLVNSKGLGIKEDDTFASGTYTVSNSDASLSFKLPEGCKTQDIINALDGVKFRTNHSVIDTALDSFSVQLSAEGSDTNSFLGSLVSLPFTDSISTSKLNDHTINADSDGIQIDSFARVSWEDIGIDKSNYSGEDISFTHPTLGIRVSFGVKDGMTLQNVIDSINSSDLSDSIGINNRIVYSGSGSRINSFISFNGGERKQLGLDLVNQMGNYSNYEKGTAKIPITYGKFQVGDDGTLSLLIYDSNDPTKNVALTGSSLRDIYGNNSTINIGFNDGDKSYLYTSYQDKNFANNVLESSFSFTMTFDSSSFSNEDDFVDAVKNSSFNGMTTQLLRYREIHNFSTSTGYVGITKDSVSGLSMDDSFVADEEIPKEMPVKKLWIQSGADKDNGLWLEFGGMDTDIIGIRGLDVSTTSGAKYAIGKVKDALSYVSSLRSTIGAQQNRLTHTIDNQNNVIENTQAAESRIRDADMSKETVNYSKDNILMQAGQAMLAQANQSKQGLLSLLQ